MVKDLKTYFYSVVRFVPDRIRGEAVNLGVIIVDDDAGISTATFLRRFKSRVRYLDPLVHADPLERLVDTLKERCGPQSQLVGDARISSKRHLASLSETMKNQLQVSPPTPYRATSLAAAAEALFAEVVSPHRKPTTEADGMSLRQLRSIIRQTLRDWGSAAFRVEEDKLQRGVAARHYADFWLEAGTPVAAFIAIPDDPDERDIAWARRDSVPTIAGEFRELNPQFKTVVVFPPNGHEPPLPFVEETEGLFAGRAGIIVAHADELSARRSEIAGSLL